MRLYCPTRWSLLKPCVDDGEGSIEQAKCKQEDWSNERILDGSRFSRSSCFRLDIVHSSALRHFHPDPPAKITIFESGRVVGRVSVFQFVSNPWIQFLFDPVAGRAHGAVS